MYFCVFIFFEIKSFTTRAILVLSMFKITPIFFIQFSFKFEILVNFYLPVTKYLKVKDQFYNKKEKGLRLNVNPYLILIVISNKFLTCTLYVKQKNYVIQTK